MEPGGGGEHNFGVVLYATIISSSPTGRGFTKIIPKLRVMARPFRAGRMSIGKVETSMQRRKFLQRNRERHSFSLMMK